MRREITIQNISQHSDIQVTVGQIETTHIELPPTSLNGVISRNSEETISLDFDGGCSTLFVWSVRAKRLLWRGVVPVGSTQPLVIDPDSRNVTYSGVTLPECPDVHSREYFQGTDSGIGVANEKKGSCGLSPIIIGIFIAFLIISSTLYIAWLCRN